ncbi:head-tail connector protein [Wukongibacter sp. M2B1]|uniref:head-tail connector protein n=1 Tax=Wukongibacter sp. M2B1 TaxID=3088895 RepID=UPI003D7A3B3D
MTLNEAKLYLRLEEDYLEEDDLLSALIVFSEEYIKNATGKTSEFFSENELYKLAQKMIISHIYDNRLPVVVGSITKKLEFSLRSILIQLQYSYEEEV